MSKRLAAIREKVERGRAYEATDALRLLKETANPKFDETVEVAVNLGVDPRKSDQIVRGATVLPNGTGKEVRVAVFATGPRADEAREAGADVVGLEEIAEKVRAGEIEFDVAIATPDSMRVVGQLGRILAPRAHAEPEDGDGDRRRLHRGRERQGRPDPVPDRPGGDHPLPDREAVVRGRGPDGEPRRPRSRSSSGRSRRRPRVSISGR